MTAPRSATLDRPALLGMGVVGFSAAVLSFSTWVSLAESVGFTGHAVVFGVTLRLAWLLPLAIDWYTVTVIRVWLRSPVGSLVLAYAKGNAIAAIALSVAGQAAYHAFTAAGVAMAHQWWFAVLIGGIPPALLGLVMDLYTRMKHEQTATDELVAVTATAPATAVRAASSPATATAPAKPKTAKPAAKRPATAKPATPPTVAVPATEPAVTATAGDPSPATPAIEPATTAVADTATEPATGGFATVTDIHEIADKTERLRRWRAANPTANQAAAIAALAPDLVGRRTIERRWPVTHPAATQTAQAH